MDYNYIRKKSSEVIIDCNVKSFPIDCFQILNHYHHKIYTYSELYKKNKELYDMCLSYSEDAFLSGSMKLIAYNDRMPKQRIRFSLMHELGHHVLEHKNDTLENEEEANLFASNMLAPRLAIYYSQVRTRDELCNLFDLSLDDSYQTEKDFIRWCKDVAAHTRMHDYDVALYNHFRDDEHGFVYSIRECEFCGAKIYNSTSTYCVNGCRPIKTPMRRRSCFDSLSDVERKILSKCRNSWLYNFL